MCSLYNWVTTCLVRRRPRATRHQNLADLGTLPENVLFLPWQRAMDGKENKFLRPTNPLLHAVGSAVTTMSGFVGCGGGLVHSPPNGLVVLPGQDSWRELAKFVSDTEWTTITAVQPLLSDRDRYKLETEKMLRDIQAVTKSILIQQEMLQHIAENQNIVSEDIIHLTEGIENIKKANGEALHRVKTIVHRVPGPLLNINIGDIAYNDNREMAPNHAQGGGVDDKILKVIDFFPPARTYFRVIRDILDFFNGKK
jgi:hypothetical protein